MKGIKYTAKEKENALKKWIVDGEDVFNDFFDFHTLQLLDLILFFGYTISNLIGKGLSPPPFG